jgi:DNA polymerase V
MDTAANDRRFIGYVYAGFPSPATDYREEDIDIKKYLMPNTTSIYLARVDGESMANANIPHGSIVVIDKALKPVHNSIVIAIVDGNRLIKRLIKTQGGIFLSPANSNFPPIKIENEKELNIWGVVRHAIVSFVKNAK